MSEGHTVGVTSMLIFSVCYLGIFFLLMSALPVLAPNLLYGGKQYASIPQKEFLSQDDIESIKYLEGYNLTFPISQVTHNFNPAINVKIVTNWVNINPYIGLEHITWELWDGSYPYIYHSDYMIFRFYNLTINQQEYYYLGKTQLNQSWNTKYNASIFSASTANLKTKCWFTDTNTTRNNIDDAWDDGEITLSIGFGYDDLTISYNAFNLVGLLLTFQRPDIFGASGTTAILLNMIVALPTFLCIAYLIYYFITSIIPFISGA